MSALAETMTVAPSAVSEPPVAAATAPSAGPTYAFPAHWSLADLQSHLGDVPAERIRIVPPPGYATEGDVVRLQESKEGLCELIDGVLVEKPMGAFEARLATVISFFLETFLTQHDLGITIGADGPVRTIVPQVRMPDVCFISWDKLPRRRFPNRKVLPFAPDLAIEVLSESNTRREMARKLDEYFAAGTRLVWYFDADARSVQVFTAVEQFAVVNEDEELDGGDVLPGFRLKLRDLFARAGLREE